MSRDGVRKGAVGRGDLIEARRHGPTSADEQVIAKLLGFVENRLPTEESGNAGGQTGSSVRLESTALPPLDPKTPTLFWRATQIEIPRGEGKEAVVQAAQPTEEDFFGINDIVHETPPPPPPDPPSIVPWSHLRRAMEEVYRRVEPTGEIDVDAVIHELGRGAPLTRVPRRARWVRTRRLIVILDRAERLMPFWRDQYEVYIRLRLEFGAGVHHVWWDAGPPRWTRDADVLACVSPELQPGDTVLVLGDLGHYGLASLRRVWGRLGAALRRCGVSTAALVPCPADRWDSAAIRSWRTIDWGKPSTDATTRPGAEDDNEQCELLLTLLSWTALTEPALVREVRMLVPNADTGTEADAWSYPGTIRKLSTSLRPVGTEFSEQDEWLARPRPGRARAC